MKRAHKTTNNPKMRSWIFRTINGLIWGNYELNKFGHKDDIMCQYCNKQIIQTKSHLLGECEEIDKLWDLIYKKFKDLFPNKLTEIERRVGVSRLHQPTETSTNTVIFNTIKCIFDNNNKDEKLSIHKIINKLMNIEKTEYSIAESNDKVELHLNKWMIIKTCLKNEYAKQATDK